MRRLLTESGAGIPIRANHATLKSGAAGLIRAARADEVSRWKPRTERKLDLRLTTTDMEVARRAALQIYGKIMIHADDALIDAWARECRRRHPGVRLENWRIYVRTMVAAVNEISEPPEPLRAAFNDGPAGEIVGAVLKRINQ